MKIGINKFLNIFYSIMIKDEINSVNVIDIIEVVKILFSSAEFEMLSSRLDINEFTEEHILNHPYTTEFDDDGFVSFEIPEEQIKAILSKNRIDAGYIQQAINKRAIVKYVNAKTNGLLEFKYDNPNGVYNLPSINEEGSLGETELFTDGVITNNTFYRGNEYGNNSRAVKVSDATYTIVLYSINGILGKGELRGTYLADYNMVYDQTQKLIHKNINSYDVIVSEKPKVYKFKRH